MALIRLDLPGRGMLSSDLLGMNIVILTLSLCSSF